MKSPLAAALAAALAFAAALPAAAQPAPAQSPAASARVADAYKAYEFLIGDWDTIPADGRGPSIHQRFEWGPRQSFIAYTTSMRQGSGPESVHFMGWLVWNGASGKLDYLVVVEPGSGSQERGEIRAGTDGSIVRDVTLTGPDGKVSHFRQTFRSTGPDSAVTALMRQTATGWEPNFPGSDRLEMKRRPA